MELAAVPEDMGMEHKIIKLQDMGLAVQVEVNIIMGETAFV